MHHDITTKLWDAIPADKKSDFWGTYLYLKYTTHFFNKSIETAGMKTMDLPPLDPTLEEMLHALAWQVAESVGSADTSVYHGKVVRPQDARQLVTQKEDVNLIPPERVVPFKVARDIVLENPESMVVDEAKSMGCGVCENSCPIDAIQMRREPSKGDPLDLEELKAQGLPVR